MKKVTSGFLKKKKNRFLDIAAMWAKIDHKTVFFRYMHNILSDFLP